MKCDFQYSKHNELFYVSLIYIFNLSVNTKVEVRFHLSSATWIPEQTREKLSKLVSIVSNFNDILGNIDFDSDCYLFLGYPVKFRILIYLIYIN